MSRLHMIINDALDRADSDWQHGVAPMSATTYISDMAMAIEKALVDASGGVDHIVRVNGSRWTIQHPLVERFEWDEPAALMSCRYVTLISTACAIGDIGDGEWCVWLDDTGVLRWKER